MRRAKKNEHRKIRIIFLPGKITTRENIYNRRIKVMGSSFWSIQGKEIVRIEI